MPNQTEAGKAFEYALLFTAGELLKDHTIVNIINDQALKNTEQCFNLYNELEQQQYIKAAGEALNHLIRLEPMLTIPGETINIQVLPDAAGIQGDVRDVLFSRPKFNWEVGISAKNNHRAVKHSRLSDLIDFGNEWLELPCQGEYFVEITPTFAELRNLKGQGKAWKELPNKSVQFYQPILSAFSNELQRLNHTHPGQVPAALLKYLIGRNDFYKIIKGRNKIEINGFNIHGTLNRASATRPQIKVPKLNLPTRIIEITPKPGSRTTLLLTCDHGWQLSFRIHNASTKVEPSLKFDINLVGQPQSIYSHHINW